MEKPITLRHEVLRKLDVSTSIMPLMNNEKERDYYFIGAFLDDFSTWYGGTLTITREKPFGYTIAYKNTDKDIYWNSRCWVSSQVVHQLIELFNHVRNVK